MYLDGKEEGDPLVVAGLGRVLLAGVVRLVHDALHVRLDKRITFGGFFNGKFTDFLNSLNHGR